MMHVAMRRTATPILPSTVKLIVHTTHLETSRALKWSLWCCVNKGTFLNSFEVEHLTDNAFAEFPRSYKIHKSRGCECIYQGRQFLGVKSIDVNCMFLCQHCYRWMLCLCCIFIFLRLPSYFYMDFPLSDRGYSAGTRQRTANSVPQIDDDRWLMLFVYQLHYLRQICKLEPWLQTSHLWDLDD